MIDMTKVNLAKLDPDELAVFEWQYHLCGGFHEALWQAIKRADDSNLSKIACGFPIEIQGFSKYKNEPGWWQEVERKVVTSPSKLPTESHELNIATSSDGS